MMAQSAILWEYVPQARYFEYFLTSLLLGSHILAFCRVLGTSYTPSLTHLELYLLQSNVRSQGESRNAGDLACRITTCSGLKAYTMSFFPAARYAPLCD